jgi:hypothetical protein
MGTLLKSFFGFDKFSKELEVSAETEHLDRLSAQLDCHIECLEFLYKSSKETPSELAIPKFRARLLADQF